MNVLVDTHALLWFVDGHPNLSTTADATLSDPANEILFGAGSIWEIAIKAGLGKLTLSQTYEAFIKKAIDDTGLTILPIKVEHGAVLINLPQHHRDPFDRLLVAQAIVEQIPIISADPALDAYPITRLW
jgi:PIN domain nuclease of toxin-antitoxin system